MIFLDAHVHLYPAHDRDRLFNAFMANARCLAPQAQHLAMAIMLREGQGDLPDLLRTTGRPGQRWNPRGKTVDGAMLAGDGTNTILLIPARQIAVRERIELLGLFAAADIPDGLPAAETLQRLRDAEALTILAWGLGKWLFQRHAVVRALIDAAEPPAGLLIGDSAMRPSFWAMPRLMARARNRGLRIVYGSDPLPRPGDESLAGSYASLIEGTLSTETPLKDLRSLLTNPAVPIRPVGHRHNLSATLQRLR